MRRSVRGSGLHRKIEKLYVCGRAVATLSTCGGRPLDDMH